MNQNYKIYISGTPVIITSSSPSAESINYKSVNDLKKAIALANSDKPPREIIINSRKDAEEVFESFKSLYTYVEAGGGLVLNGNNELLFIFRKGKWDLPKGKRDEGEEILDSAVREIKEETGVQVTEVIKKLTPTYHTYTEKGRDFLKINHWYLMRSLENNVPEPQVKEDITRAEWLKQGKALEEALSNTYPAIRDVVGEYLAC